MSSDISSSLQEALLELINRTIIQFNLPFTIFDIRRFGKGSIIKVIFKLSLIFSDGCPFEVTNASFSWPETNLGTVVTLNCSCNGLSLGVGQPVATRTCSGNFTNGAEWDTPNTLQCETFTDEVQLLCNTTQVTLNFLIFVFNLKLLVTYSRSKCAVDNKHNK